MYMENNSNNQENYNNPQENVQQNQQTNDQQYQQNQQSQQYQQNQQYEQYQQSQQYQQNPQYEQYQQNQQYQQNPQYEQYQQNQQYQQPNNGNFVKGPVGVVRNPLLIILYSILSCGIYFIVWLYQVSKEINDYTRAELTEPSYAIIGIFCFVFTYLNMYKVDQAIVTIDNVEGRRSESRFVLWLLLTLLAGVGGLIMMYQVQESLNNVWYSNGVPRQ